MIIKHNESKNTTYDTADQILPKKGQLFKGNSVTQIDLNKGHKDIIIKIVPKVIDGTEFSVEFKCYIVYMVLGI